MSECLSGWYRGVTCDHVYDDCPARQRGKPEMVRVGWWGDEQITSIPLDVHGTDVCGLCVRRHNRTTHREDRAYG